MANPQAGYQPRNTPAERRAFFDLQRRLRAVEENGGGGGGGDAPNEVHIGPTPPTDPDVELWYDTDAVAGPVDVVYAYVHNQSSPASVWTINHPLAFYPNITVVSSAGDQVEGDVDYVDADTITVTFSSAFSGKAYLS